MGITVLWVALWVQFAVVPAPWNRATAFTLFGIACADTVLYGMSMQRRPASTPRHATVFSSAAVGLRTLAAVSWAPFLGAGIFLSVASLSIGPLALILFFGIPVSLAFAVVGYVALLILLGVGAALVWLQQARRRRC